MTSDVLLGIQGLHKSFGGVAATNQVTLDILDGEVHAIIGPNGAGKTSLVEAMLHASGAISRLGNIADGNTVCDYEPEEIDRASSIQLALGSTEWDGVKVNWLDTPGYADFAGEVLSAIAAAASS